MGTSRRISTSLSKVAAKAVYGIDVHMPGMKWAGVKSLPVYGGKVKSY